MYPLGDDFRDLFPAPKQMTYKTDRWDWIKPSTPTGILSTWNTAPIATKHAYVYSYLTSDAMRFSLVRVTTIDPITSSLITFPLPIFCNDDKDVP